MGRYVIRLEVEAESLDGAFALGVRFLRREAVVGSFAARPTSTTPGHWERPVVDYAGALSGLTVTPAPPRSDDRDAVYSVHLSGDRRYSPGREVLLCFTPSGQGKIMLIDDAGEPQSRSITLSAASVAELVRELHGWPLELINEIAARDLRRRRG